MTAPRPDGRPVSPAATSGPIPVGERPVPVRRAATVMCGAYLLMITAVLTMWWFSA